MFNAWRTDLDKLNSMTKYPSIPTFHPLGDKGRISNVDPTDWCRWKLEPEIIVTEKIDGTNARLIICPDGQIIFGSREELLGCFGDLISNPTQGIVETLTPLTRRLYGILELTKFDIHKVRAQVQERDSFKVDSGIFLVLYGEVYGGGIEAWKKYTLDPGLRSFRLFDVMLMQEHDYAPILDMERPRIARWREQMKQPYLNEQELVSFAQHHQIALAPRRATVSWSELPTDVATALDFLTKYAPTSHCLLDTNAQAATEGVVLRTPGRTPIAKLRWDDYRRAARG